MESFPLFCSTSSRQALEKQIISEPNGATIALSMSDFDLLIEYRAPDFVADGYTVFIALATHREIGSAVVPFQREREGSTVFLSFNADLLIYAKSQAESALCMERRWENWKWSDAAISTQNHLKIDNRTVAFQLPRTQFGAAKTINCAIYAKDLSQNNGWGRFLGCNDRTVETGPDDKYIARYLEINLAAESETMATQRARLGGSKMRIYQLFVRLFGNTNEARKPNGTLAQNGVGKFNHINDAALKSLRKMGFTHIWLMGVLQQASWTDYSSIGQPADDPDLLKGIAGSPYAIKDYFEVCPDYAVKPEKRLDEFKSLLERIHKHGMKALIDLVPNHVARSYDSDVRPELNFGIKDDKSIFFSPQNNFFYLKPNGSGPPLHLPTCQDSQPISATCKAVAALYERRNGGTTSVSSQVLGRDTARPSKCDGFFDGEMTFGRATGNNVVSWTPAITDWYETAKLNYGFDFTGFSKNVRE